MNKVFCIIIFFNILLFAQQQFDHIAVLNLEANGVSEAESITLTDRLRNELVSTNKFIVIERSEMASILDEQGFQNSGCTSNECAVEIGKLLNIRTIVAGSIGKVGSLFSISLRMIDVETGKILYTVNEDCECPIESVLKISIKNLAQKLASKSIGNINTTIEEGKGDIYVKSVPSGAQIFLNGDNTGLLTPAALKNLESGQNIVKLQKENYVKTKVINVKPNEIEEETFYLSTAFGGIKIYTSPSEAEILIDNKPYGLTPKIIKNLAIGEHLVTLTKKGFIKNERKIKIISEKIISIDTTLENGVKDIDDNYYHIIQVGNQTWMIENLKVTHYRNGDPIKEIETKIDWRNIKEGAFCKFNNSDELYNTGLLYNWYAVNDQRRIAPEGWHIPSPDEWLKLLKHLQKNINIDNSKNISIESFNSGNAIDISYKILGVERLANGYFSATPNIYSYWGSNELNEKNAWCLQINNSNFKNLDLFKNYGLFIRCIKDNKK